MYVDWKVTGKQQAEGKRVKTGVYTRATIIKEAQSQGQNSLHNLYIPRTSLTICFSSMMIVALCFDAKRCACPQPFACTIPHGWRTRKTLSAYAYTSFVSKLVLAKLELLAKSRQTTFRSITNWPHCAWARCHHYETESALRTNRVHHFRSWRSFDPRPSPDFSPRLRDKIWEGPWDEARLLYHISEAYNLR